MINLESRHETVDDVLGLSLGAIDIPGAVRDRAISRYREVASWLAEYWQTSNGGEIYSQGSFRLGTVVRPIFDDGEYDMDLVCRIDVLSISISQKGLKDRVGEALRAYVATNPVGSPKLEERTRCWTLDYPGEPFHMDVLPAIPDLDGDPDAIKITDRELHRWQPSNPIAFAHWFRGEMAEELWVLKKAEAAARALDVEDVPEDEIKTTLQRAVQALKRHRDIAFANEPKAAPASIIITTLAALAYTGRGALYDVLVDVTRRMPDCVDVIHGEYVVMNPVCEGENFADRWRSEPRRARLFFEWMDQAARDFGGLWAADGADDLLDRVRKSFGDRPARDAALKFAGQLTDRRSSGLLTVGSVGTVGAIGRRSVPDHTFHGDAPSSPAT